MAVEATPLAEIEEQSPDWHIEADWPREVREVRMMWKSALTSTALFCIMGAALFLPAGTIGWRAGWIFLIEMVLLSIATVVWLAKHDPGLLKERMASPIQKGQGRPDKIFMSMMVAIWHGWIVLMALDHVRDFFHAAAYQGQNPLDVDHTSVVLYVTRWATHPCAPTFVFLAGTGAFLRGNVSGVATRADKTALSWFLVTRGAWLLLLEATYVGWLGWLMSFEPRLYNMQVLWALGGSMISTA